MNVGLIYYMKLFKRCHVMEVESFEDEGVAKLLNDLFVSIKVSFHISFMFFLTCIDPKDLIFKMVNLVSWNNLGKNPKLSWVLVKSNSKLSLVE